MSPVNPKEKCCGECIPSVCVINDKEYKIGEKWYSDDYCINYVCLNKNGAVSFHEYLKNKIKKDFSDIYD